MKEKENVNNTTVEVLDSIYESIKDNLSGIPGEYCGTARKVKEILFNNGYKHDIMIHDPDPRFRYYIAGNSKECAKELIDDPSPFVRIQVAEHGIGLEKLVNDPYPGVREEVAKHGYCLDRLINDDNQFVRDAARKYLNPYENNTSK